MTPPAEARTVGMTRTAWDALPPAVKREEPGACWLVHPEGKGEPVRVTFLDLHARPLLADVLELEARLVAHLNQRR